MNGKNPTRIKSSNPNRPTVNNVSRFSQFYGLSMNPNSVREAKHSTKGNLKTFSCTMAELCRKPAVVFEIDTEKNIKKSEINEYLFIVSDSFGKECLHI